MQLLIYSDTIQFIQIPFEKSIRKEFDINTLIATELQTSTLSNENSDQIIVENILKHLKPEVKEKFEISDAFEIELNGKRYYTILDMEDGNYIAINKKGSVFRLIHDNEEPAKEIAPSILDLEYKGDKSELNHLF